MRILKKKIVNDKIVLDVFIIRQKLGQVGMKSSGLNPARTRGSGRKYQL